MSKIVPFQFDNQSIRVVADEHGDPLFVAKDVALALGYANVTTAIQQHCKGVAKYYPLQTSGGTQEASVLTEPDVLRLIIGSNLPAAEAFERWVFEEVLPSIRKTGSYTAVNAEAAKPTAIQPTKEFRALFGVARLIGLDKNVAAISANQAVAKLTGTNVLQLLGHQHLEAESHALFFTPTELGERLGISGRKFNMLLAEAGLQAKKGEHWSPLPAADGFFRVLDTGKRHGDGTMVQQLKWAENVLSLVQQTA